MKKDSYKHDNRGHSDSEWQLQEAKACFSEVVRRAKEEPQRVSVHGKPSAVVISADYYERMLPKSGADLADLMASAPLDDLEFGKAGEAMPVREVEL